MTIFVDSSSVSQIDSYTGLIDAVGNWMDRSDLNPRIPDFIRLAEARFRRLLVMPDMETQVTFSPANAISLPADFDSMKLLVILSPCQATMRQVSLSEYYDLNPNVEGRPSQYATTNSTLLSWPSPDQTYTAMMTYRAMLPSLGSNPTNWLLSAHPDVYLYAAILEAEGFLVNDERVPNIKALLDEKLDEIMRAGNRKRFGGGPLVMGTGINDRAAGINRYGARW